MRGRAGGVAGDRPDDAGGDAAVDGVVAELAACALLRLLPTAALECLAAQAVRRRYARGQALFRVGDPSDRVWIICAGRVQASRSADGREFIAHVASAGEAPGHLDLMDLSPRSVDAYAVDAVEALVLPAVAVREALVAHPDALMALVVDLVHMVRVLSELAADTALLDLRCRIAKHLLAQPEAGCRVAIGFPQAALAAHFGVARQSLNRALGDLQRRGLIRVIEGGRSIELLDEMTLRRLAAGLSPR